MSGDIRLRREFIATALLLVLLALLPLVQRDVYWLGVLVVSAYFAILASSWNLLAGFTGQFSLAPAAFAMIGAYGAALSATYYSVPPILGLIIGTGAAGLIGLVLGRIVMRLKGPYLALTTLSFAGNCAACCFQLDQYHPRRSRPADRRLVQRSRALVLRFSWRARLRHLRTLSALALEGRTVPRGDPG